MDDPRDAVAKAKKKLKQFAASALVQKEAAEKDLGALRSDRDRIKAEMERALDANNDQGALELTELLGQVETKIHARESDLEVAQMHYEQSLSEMKGLDGTLQDLEHAKQRAVIDAVSSPGDAMSTRPEDIALRNVREHLSKMEAEIALNSELSGESERRAEAKLQKDLSEIEAKAQLEALKAKRRGRKSDAADNATASPAEDSPGDDGDDDGSPAKRKRTM